MYVYDHEYSLYGHEYVDDIMECQIANIVTNPRWLFVFNIRIETSLKTVASSLHLHWRYNNLAVNQ